MKCVIFVVCVSLAVASAQFARFSPPRGFGQPSRAFTPAPPPPAPRPSAPRASTDDRSAQTLRENSDIQPDGAFNYVYETSNGISAQAQGTPKNFGGNPPLIPDVISGNFGWTSPEGQRIDIVYVADENGYQPSGSAIPTPPPIPEAILRALQRSGVIQRR